MSSTGNKTLTLTTTTNTTSDCNRALRDSSSSLACTFNVDEPAFFFLENANKVCASRNLEANASAAIVNGTTRRSSRSTDAANAKNVTLTATCVFVCGSSKST